MTSPTLELQGAVAARLKAQSAMAALVSQRVYDVVPADPVFPYISFGPSDEVTVDAECIEGIEVSLQIDAWSRAPGFPEVRKIADAVRRTIHRHEFNLPDNALVLFEHRVTRMFRDPDGLTSHAAMTFTAFVEQP